MRHKGIGALDLASFGHLDVSIVPYAPMHLSSHRRARLTRFSSVSLAGSGTSIQNADLEKWNVDSGRTGDKYRGMQ